MLSRIEATLSQDVGKNRLEPLAAAVIEARPFAVDAVCVTRSLLVAGCDNQFTIGALAPLADIEATVATHFADAALVRRKLDAAPHGHLKTTARTGTDILKAAVVVVARFVNRRRRSLLAK